MSNNELRQAIRQTTGIDIGASDQQVAGTMFYGGLAGGTALAGSMAFNAVRDRIDITDPLGFFDPRERMARQLLTQGHASVDDIMRASYGEWPPKGLDIVTPNSQRVSFGNILDRANEMPAKNFFGRMRNKWSVLESTFGDATLEGDRVIRMSGLRLSTLPSLMGKSALSSTMGHEAVHILQGDNFYRAGQLYGYRNSHSVAGAQMVLGGNDPLRSTFNKYADPNFKPTSHFNYVKDGVETQARIHEIAMEGYQRWGQLPANREQFLVAMKSAGLEVPDEVMKGLDNSPTIAETRRIFGNDGGFTSRVAGDVNYIQAGLTDAGKIEFWNKSMPTLYADLIEMYGDGPGRARFEMGVNPRPELRQKITESGPVAATRREYVEALERGDPLVERMVEPGALDAAAAAARPLPAPTPNLDMMDKIDAHMRLLDKVATEGQGMIWLRKYGQLVEQAGPDTLDLAGNGDVISRKLGTGGLIGDASAQTDFKLDPEASARNSIARSISEINNPELGYPDPARLNYDLDLYTRQGIRDTAHRPAVDEVTYKPINPDEYFDHSKAVPARKTAVIEARPARPGEEISVIMRDGTLETTEIAREGQMLVMNPGGEKYLVNEEKFAKQYMATGDGNTYTLKGDQPVRQVMKLDEDVSFKAPWGEDMHIKKGGVLVYNDPGDIYGIQPEEFKSTYSFVGDANNIKSAGATIEADATPSHADYVKEYGEPGTMPGKKGIDASYEDYERAYNEGRFEEAARMRRPASSIPSHADYVAEYGEPGAMPETATVEKAFRESRITTSGAEAVADAAKYAGDAKYLEGVEGAARRMHGGLIVNAVVGAGVGILTYNATGSLAESGEASLAAIVPYAQTAEQLAAGDTKGAVKSAMTETAGIAGAIAGASSGAAIGATIGSIVPVVGTVIGGAVGGIVGGVVGGVAAGFGTDFLLTEVPEIVDTVHDGIKSGLNYVGITDDDLHDAYTQTMDVVHDVGDTIGEAYAATAAVASDVSDSIDAAYRETEDAAASAYNAVADTASSGWKTLTSLFNSEAEPETMVAEATHEAEKTAGADMPMDDAADVEMTWEKAHTALPGEIDPEMPPEVQSLVAVKVSKELFQRQFSELEEHGGLTEVSAYIEKNPVPAEVRSTQQQDMANDIAVRNETMARQNNSSMSLG